MSLSDMPQEKQKLVMIGLVAVIVIVGGYFAYSTFFAGSADTSMPAPMEGDYGQPGPIGGPGVPPPGPPGYVPGPEGAPVGGTPGPGSDVSAPPTTAPPAQRSTPAPAARPAPPAPETTKSATKSITVFESITVNYPSGWGIALSSAGSAAVITDGKARFELHAPDPKASNAKAIAEAAAAKLAKSANVISEGPIKMAGFDAYQLSINGPAGPTKIVGVDARTRIAIIEYVKGGQMAAYRAAFDKMEAELQFR